MGSFLESVRNVSPWVVAPVVFAVWVLSLIFVKRLIFSRIKAFAANPA